MIKMVKIPLLNSLVFIYQNYTQLDHYWFLNPSIFAQPSHHIKPAIFRVEM